MPNEALPQTFLRTNPLAFEIVGLMMGSKKKLTITEISSILEKKQPSIHRVLNKLLKNGLVEKERSGRFAFYYVPSNKKDIATGLINNSLKSETFTQTRAKPPFFMLLSLESRISKVISDSIGKSGRFKVARNLVIPGRSFDHEFDIVIENKSRVAIEIISSSDRIDRHLFEIVGRLADLPSNSVDKIVLVILGHLHQPSIFYLKSLNLEESPRLEIVTLEEDISKIDDDTIKEKIVPLIETVLVKPAKQSRKAGYD